MRFEPNTVSRSQRTTLRPGLRIPLVSVLLAMTATG